MTETQQWIIHFLTGKGWTSPTKIGEAYGRMQDKDGYHSSWSSPKCLVLVQKGILERNDNGHYRLKPGNIL
jgi:hypothetical protein